MTTVTKIFIVLVCLFALIFTPMAISFAARTQNWRALAQELQDVAETALARERHALATAASTVEHYKALRDRETQRGREHEQRIADLEREVEALTQEREELGRSRASWENSARTLSAQMEVINTHNQNLLQERKRLAESEQNLQQQLARCEDDLAAQSANNVILSRYLMQRKEELAAVREENDQLRRKLGLGRAAGEPLTSVPKPTAQPGAPAARSEIRGTVTGVREAQNLVSVNVGSASGLAEGVIMVVIRGDEYICDLVITGEVDPTEAVGRVRTPGGKQVRPGDTVIDEASFVNR